MVDNLKELFEIQKRFEKKNPNFLNDYEKFFKNLEKFEEIEKPVKISPQEQFFGTYKAI